MSLEMELLDQLCGGDESLYFTLQVFGWPDNSQALEHARYSIIKQMKEGLIKVKQKEGDNERVLPEWEAKQVVSNDANWMKQGAESEYYLSLTEKGTKYIAG